MITEMEDTRALAIEADRIEACAWADWYAAIPSELRSEFGFDVRSVADATLLLAPRIPLTVMNRAVGLGMTRPASADDVDAVVKTFVDAGCLTFGIGWGPGGEPATTGRLMDAMFPQRSRTAKMARGTILPSPAVSELRVVACDRSLVADTDRALAFSYGAPFLVGVLAPLFWRPRWHLYAVLDGDAVVGCGALFLDGAHAWVGMGAVLPEYRRRGGQRSLMVQRIRDAIAAGATRIFTDADDPLQAGANPSLNNMERCGFEKIVSRTEFIGPA